MLSCWPQSTSMMAGYREHSVRVALTAPVAIIPKALSHSHPHACTWSAMSSENHPTALHECVRMQGFIKSTVAVRRLLVRLRLARAQGSSRAHRGGGGGGWMVSSPFTRRVFGHPARRVSGPWLKACAA